MKKLLFLSILMLLPMLASAQTVSDVQNSGCLNKTRGDESQSVPTIVLTKEGNILSVQLLNYEENCCAEDFNVTSSINSNSDSGSYWVSINIDAGGWECDCTCPFNVSFTVRDLEPNSFYLDCWWYEGLVELTEGEPLVLEHNDSGTQEYFPEGTKWTEIRLDTLKYDSWYSKVGDEWVPNFETIEYYVKGKYSDGYGGIYNCVYTNGPEWTDSLMLLIPSRGDFLEPNSVMVSVLSYEPEGVYAFWPAEVYQFDWNVGKGIYYENILMANTTSAVRSQGYYGIIHEIKEGYFGGVRPLKYVDLDGKAPENKPHSNIKNGSTKGGRIIQGIGITEWNDGECLFGPPDPYGALDGEYHGRHYRSMLVHFERNGEVLYNVWPEKETTDDSDYLPFVDRGKRWIVTRATPGRDGIDEVEYSIPLDVEEVDGKDYYRMKTVNTNNTETETYLIREESQKVYYYDPDLKMEFLAFDYSLKEGDTYETYSYETHEMVTYTVWSVEDYTGGPQVKEYYYDENTGNMAVRYRYLRKWVASSYIESEYCYEPKVWIEGVGSLERPLTNLYQGSFTLDCLAYVLYNGQYDLYLPFSFNATDNKVLWYGRNMPISAKDDNSEDEQHQLTYEMEGDRLHVYGEVFCNCGPNHYAYFIEEPTDDHSVRKLHFKIQDVEPLVWCEALHTTDFYVEGLPPAFDYIIVDNQGEEHPVINKAPLNVYRPFIQDDKVWAVKVITDGLPTEEWMEYYYFDGDTIVGGQVAKRMLCDRISSSQDTTGEYVGAWYEQDQKVYFAGNGKQQFELLYDFTLKSLDTMPNLGGSISVVYKWTGIYTGFKGTLYTFGQERWYEGVGSNSWPYVNHPWYLDSGRKGILLVCKAGDQIIYYNSEEEDPFSMGAKKHRFDFTHTIKTKPKAPSKREKSDARINSSEREVARPKVKARTREDNAETLYGEYNNLLLGINLNPLDDTYLVRITNESDQVVYEKTINAGSIVGLNIDISAFAKGRYTVTIENSGESFTGEFETQTTGIQELKSSRIEELKSIYNLQGQQLKTAPQKGIYIRNGKKVVIK